MDLDESGVEAFEAEAAASTDESTPTTFANVTPLTSSTPRTSGIVVEGSTPVAPKTRKPRGLKKVEEDEKEKVEEPPSKVKEEKAPEEKKLPTVNMRLSSILSNFMKRHCCKASLMKTFSCFRCRRLNLARGKFPNPQRRNRVAAENAREKLRRQPVVSLRNSSLFQHHVQSRILPLKNLQNRS